MKHRLCSSSLSLFIFAILTVIFYSNIEAEAQYCTPQGYYPYAGYMTRFTFNGIDNSSSYASSGYSDYTSVRSNPCILGQTYQFTVNGSSWWNCAGYVIWVDWNQDGSFNNTDERVAYKYESCRGNWTRYYAGNITIPSTARPGNTRMRICYAGHH